MDRIPNFPLGGSNTIQRAGQPTPNTPGEPLACQSLRLVASSQTARWTMQHPRFTQDTRNSGTLGQQGLDVSAVDGSASHQSAVTQGTLFPVY